MTAVASVCVATYDRADRLARLLAALAAQDVTGFEVIVYDDASTDGTAAVLAEWGARLPLVVLRGETNAGPAHGRNAAWRAATAPVVLFTDDDCVPCPGWVRAHLVAHRPGRVTVGRTLPDPAQAGNAGPFSRSLTVTDATMFQTANTGYPRSLLAQLDGFDEGFRRAAGEDTELGLRALDAGAEAVHLAEALVHHDIRPSSWRAALREATKWQDLPLVVARHPQASLPLRHSPRWWRASHPPAVLAAAGLLLGRRHPVALLAALPWLRLRTTGAAPVPCRRRQLPVVLAGQLAVDLVEVGALARGSVRHRQLLL